MNHFHITEYLNQLVLAVAGSLDSFDEAFVPDFRPADPRFGDFQANGVLPFAKRNKQNPRALATTLLEALQADQDIQELAEKIEIAGPGFINFTIKKSWISGWVSTYFGKEVAWKNEVGTWMSGQKVVIDFSSPNSAKQMHVGHIRSTVIGSSLSKLLQLCGADIVRDNHIGDWGTQFGIILSEVKRSGYDFSSPPEQAIAELENIYRQGNKAFKEDEESQKQAHQELQKLQAGDPENIALWKKINEVSYAAFQAVYDKLDVEFEEVLGESFYRDKVERVYQELSANGLATESDGALVVFHPEHPRYKDTPFMIRKSDGTSNYATTDLATVLYRQEEMKANRILYVTDARQKDHFEQLFLTTKKWFDQETYPTPALEHITFGTILGEDGKAIKTRSGESVKLGDLLSEAVERAYQLVKEKNPDLEEAKLQEIAQAVGIGSVCYADLMQHRTTDYVFSWKKLISFEGNTAPYLLYAVTRIHSIFNKAHTSFEDFIPSAISLTEEDEQKLARKLLDFPIQLEQCLQDYTPHTLCTYLYELAGSFSSFYSSCKVVGEAKDIEQSRLSLAYATLSILEEGLSVLGLKTLRKM